MRMQQVQVSLQAQDPLHPRVPLDMVDMVHPLVMEGTALIRTQLWDRMDIILDMHHLLSSHMVGLLTSYTCTCIYMTHAESTCHWIPHCVPI